MDSFTLISAILLSFSLSHSKAVPVLPSDAPDAESTFGKRSLQDDTVTNDQLPLTEGRENHISYSALNQFQVYKYDNIEIAGKSCNAVSKDSHPNLPAQADTTLLCPYNVTCREHNNTYPNVVINVGCKSDRDSVFREIICRQINITEIAWRQSNDTAKWIPFERKRGVACVADGAKQAKKTVEDKYKAVYEEDYCKLGRCQKKNWHYVHS